MTFRVGPKVVCIGDRWASVAEILPVIGRIYTVRAIIDHRDGCGIRLREIKNKREQYVDGFVECCFDTSGFRPIIDKKTDIGFAHEILLIQAQRIMPSTAPEAKPLKEALDGYFPQSAQIARWEKFPA